MTIQVELNPETEARLAAQAAARSMGVPAFAASLLEKATHTAPPESPEPSLERKPKHPAGRKSLAQLFAESPFHGLSLAFEQDRDFGHDTAR